MKETSRQRLFYIFPVLYIISVYMAFISFFTESRISFIHYLAFTPFIFGILNIIMSARYCKPEYYNIMFNSCIIVKYCMVPFFIAGGFLVAGSLISGILLPMPPMFIVGFALAAILCIAGWLVLAFGSPYTISYLVLSCKTGKRSKGMAVLHSILQFLFTADVIDIIFLSFRDHKCVKASIIFIILLSISIIALILIIFFALTPSIY